MRTSRDGESRYEHDWLILHNSMLKGERLETVQMYASVQGPALLFERTGMASCVCRPSLSHRCLQAEGLQLMSYMVKQRPCLA